MDSCHPLGSSLTDLPHIRTGVGDEHSFVSKTKKYLVLSISCDTKENVAGASSFLYRSWCKIRFALMTEFNLSGSIVGSHPGRRSQYSSDVRTGSVPSAGATKSSGRVVSHAHPVRYIPRRCHGRGC